MEVDEMEAALEASRPEYRKNLKAIFIMHGHRSDREIGDALGFSGATVQAVMSGRLFPSGDFQRAVARALGLRVKDVRMLL
jgi:uroporphyrinogen-III synthase